MLAQPHRRRRRPDRRDRQPQLRQPRAARDHGPARPRHRRHRRGLPRARASRSSRATSRSTTRPTAAASCRPRPSAASASSPDWSKMARIGFAGAGPAPSSSSAARRTGARISASRSTSAICFGRVEGPPPPVDLALERSTGDFVRSLIRRGIATAVHDLSDGGLAVGLAEMAMASGIGATVSELDGHEPGRAVLRRGSGPLPRDRRPRSGVDRSRHAPRGVPRHRHQRPCPRHDRRRQPDPRRRPADRRRATCAPPTRAGSRPTCRARSPDSRQG